MNKINSLSTELSLVIAKSKRGQKNRSGAANLGNALNHPVTGGLAFRNYSHSNSVTGVVPGARITQGFNANHLGIDISLNNNRGGGLTDVRRGLPVYAAIKTSIPIAQINSAARHGQVHVIEGQGDATLSEVLVQVNHWSNDGEFTYGGIVGFACRYNYTDNSGAQKVLTIYVEFLHLITPEKLPKDGNGHIITNWVAERPQQTGFGPRMINNTVLPASEFSTGTPPLIGYLGATQFPHVHVQAAIAPGSQGYLRSQRVDPELVVY